MFRPFLELGSLHSCQGVKFQLSPAPGCAGSYMNLLRISWRWLPSRRFLVSTIRFKPRWPGGHRHDFQKIAWKIPYPSPDQWVTSFSDPNLRMKFHPSPASRSTGPTQEGNFGGDGRFCSCPALSSELGLILLTSHVVRALPDLAS